MTTSSAKLNYLNTPKYCPICKDEIPYEKRANTYCSHSCATKVTNVKRHTVFNPEWHRPRRPCLTCSNTTTSKSYCSQACRNEHTLIRFHAGEIHDRGSQSNIMQRLQKTRHCESCNNTEWLGHPIPLEVDHISGDASDHTPSNLRLICPNCHGITPTWKGRNKGNGRKSRGLPTH